MNIEAYDVESLRKLFRLLEYENRLLKDKLKKENISYDEVNPFEETIYNVEEYFVVSSLDSLYFLMGKRYTNWIGTMKVPSIHALCAVSFVQLGA